MHHRQVASIGFWVAILVGAETLVFAAELAFGLAVGSSAATGYIPSILLAPSIVVLMAAAYSRCPESHRIFGLLALASALLYAPLCMGNYFVQLAVVTTNPLGLPPDVLRLVSFVPGSAAFALDMLGYVFLCLSTLAVAFTLRKPGERALRVFCILNGTLAIPTFAAPLMSGFYRASGGQSNDIGSWVNLFWCAVFLPIPILFAVLFRQRSPTRD